MLAGEGVVGEENLRTNVARDIGLAEDRHEVVQRRAFGLVEHADDADVALVAVVVVAGDVGSSSRHSTQGVAKSCACFRR